MPHQFISIENITIGYLSNRTSKAETLLFVHGNSCSSQSWHKQFADERLNDYRLIALDLPAHGQSEASPTPEKDYNLIRLGEFVAQAVKELGISHYILIGMSLGANVVAEALAYGLSPKGIVLIGPSVIGADYPMSDFILPDTTVAAVFRDDAPQALVEAYAATTSVSPNPEDRDLFLKDYYATRVPFRYAFFQSVSKGIHSDEIALLQTIDPPLCILMGADEKVVRPDYLDNAPLKLWGSGVHKIAGASHLVHIDQPHEVNRLIFEYAVDMFR